MRLLRRMCAHARGIQVIQARAGHGRCLEAGAARIPLQQQAAQFLGGQRPILGCHPRPEDAAHAVHMRQARRYADDRRQATWQRQQFGQGQDQRRLREEASGLRQVSQGIRAGVGRRQHNQTAMIVGQGHQCGG
jgi:hypothetical protein